MPLPNSFFKIALGHPKAFSNQRGDRTHTRVLGLLFPPSELLSVAVQREASRSHPHYAQTTSADFNRYRGAEDFLQVQGSPWPP